MRHFRATPLLVAIACGLATSLLAGGTPAQAATTLTVEPITWNVLGLDSNDVSVGPAAYPVGARVCNTGSDAGTVSASFVWTSSNAAIELEGPATLDLGSIPGGSCHDAYWNVTVTRAASSYGATRGYLIEATSTDGASAVTPTPRELYVERLISQNRNSVNSITGPSAVTVGDEVTYVVDADTAPAGFEQLESFLTFPSSIFQVLRATVTYEKPTGATNDTMYADACGWDPVPTSATYLTCVGRPRYDGGKVGGALLSSITVRVIGTGTAELTSAIYDKSGSSYHYNTDFSVRPNLLLVTASAPAAPTSTSAPVTPGVVPGAGDSSSTDAPAATPTTTMTVAAAPPGVATTGPSDTGLLSVFGLTLVSVGVLALAGSRLERPSPVTPFQRSLHELRRTLHEHEARPQDWLLMDALDRVARALQDR